MNKSDYILISFLVVIIIVLFYFSKTDNSLVNNALVYYDNDLILKIDLNTKFKEYKVKGYNGDVYIKAGEGKIKVLEEKSPLHLCSKQGYISKSYETIVCLPNKIVIKLESNDDLDVTVG